MKLFIALVVLAALAPRAAAQQRAEPQAANPAAPAPAAKYESGFSGYRGHREEPLAVWREVNDEVARAGGHIGILRGARSEAEGSGNPAPQPGAVPGSSTSVPARGAAHK